MADVTREILIEVNTNQAVKNVDDLNESLEENEEQTKESKDETKKYEKQMKESAAVTGAFTKQMDKLTGGMYSNAKSVLQSAKSFKSLNVILKASPLFLIVGVVGSIVAAFKRLNGPISRLQDLLGGLDGILNVLLDRLALFGQGILELGSGNADAAMQSFRESWEGVEDAMQAAYDLGVLISKQTRENSVNESARNVIIAKNNRLITEQRLIYRQVDEDAETRRAAAAEANRLQQENIELETKSARERLQIAINTFKNSSNTYEDQIAYNKALESYYTRINALEVQSIRLVAAQSQFEKQIEASKEKQTEQQEEIVKEEIELQEIQRKGVESQLEAGEKVIVQKQEEIDLTEEQKDTQLELNDAVNLTAQAATALLDIFSGKVRGKDIFKTVLRTIGSILSIIPGGQGFAAIPTVLSGLFADGGLLKGPSHAQGGVWVNAEGGEGIINKRSMSIPWVRQLASELNEIGGGVKFADGGVVPTPTSTELSLANIESAISQQQIVLPIPDLITETTKVQAIEDRATI